MLIHAVTTALSRPYSFVVMAPLILIGGILTALRTPTDIFPETHGSSAGSASRFAIGHGVVAVEIDARCSSSTRESRMRVETI